MKKLILLAFLGFAASVQAVKTITLVNKLGERLRVGFEAAGSIEGWISVDSGATKKFNAKDTVDGIQAETSSGYSSNPTPIANNKTYTFTRGWGDTIDIAAE